MKGWLFSEVGVFPSLQDLEDPKPESGQVLVEVRAAGLCRSDVGKIQGTNLTYAHLPIVLGHEVAGVVVATGPDVEDTWQPGDRVALWPMGRGESLGTSVERPPLSGVGTGRDGGYAELVIAHEHELIRIPDAVGFAQAAAAMDAGMTAHHAVHARAEVGPGQRVGIIGLGGLGLTAARLAVLADAEVYGVDVDERVFPAALEAGVLRCTTDSLELRDLTLDVVIDFAGYQQSMINSIETVRRSGRVVLVGLGTRVAELPTVQIVAKRLELRGSIGGTKADSSAVLELMASGRFEISAEEIAFEEIGPGLARLGSEGGHGKRLVACT